MFYLQNSPSPCGNRTRIGLESLSVNWRATSLYWEGLWAVQIIIIITNLVGSLSALSVPQHQVSHPTCMRQELELLLPVPATQTRPPDALRHCPGNVKPPEIWVWSPLSITMSPSVSQGVRSCCHGTVCSCFPSELSLDFLIIQEGN